MDSRDRDLPNFENPPLTEVAISVQFDSPANLQTPQIGLLWSRLRDRFPITEQHPPLDSIVESFDPPSPPPPKIRIELPSAIPTPRCWLLNNSGSELIQIQANRFVHNWRKVNKEDEYPRYEHVRKKFSVELNDFCQFLKEQELGEFGPVQCEVSDINHIESGDMWNTHGQLDRVLTVWNSQYSDDFLSAPESARVASQHVFTNGQGNPIGRLYISVQSAYTAANNEPIFVMNITARGAPFESSIQGVMDFIDRGRKEIVRGFTSITTPEMHSVWRHTR